MMTGNLVVSKLNSGAIISCLITGTIQDTSDCTVLTNTAVINSASGDITSYNNTGTATGTCIDRSRDTPRT